MACILSARAAKGRGRREEVEKLLQSWAFRAAAQLQGSGELPHRVNCMDHDELSRLCEGLGLASRLHFTCVRSTSSSQNRPFRAWKIEGNPTQSQTCWGPILRYAHILELAKALFHGVWFVSTLSSNPT